MLKRKKQEVENIKEKGRIKIQSRKGKCFRENFFKTVGGFFLLLLII